MLRPFVDNHLYKAPIVQVTHPHDEEQESDHCICELNLHREMLDMILIAGK